VLPKRSSVARLGTLALSGNFSASATWPGGGASGQRGPSWLHAPHRAAQSSAAVQPPARKQSSTRVLRKLAGTVGCQLGVACGTCSQAPPSLAGIPSQGKHHSAGNSRTLRPPCACLSKCKCIVLPCLFTMHCGPPSRTFKPGAAGAEYVAHERGLSLHSWWQGCCGGQADLIDDDQRARVDQQVREGGAEVWHVARVARHLGLQRTRAVSPRARTPATSAGSMNASSYAAARAAGVGSGGMRGCRCVSTPRGTGSTGRACSRTCAHNSTCPFSGRSWHA